jgi:hypothetical protein
MHISDVMELNAKTREKKKEFQLHHVEIHPEKDSHGNIVKGGGHTVRTIMREKGEEYGRSREAEKPFSAGEHEQMLAHVANELKLPEPKDEEHGEARESQGEEEEGDGVADE